MSHVPSLIETAIASEMPNVLFGYDVIEYIGQGAGSRIYAVSRPENKQVYALKHVVRHVEKDVRFIEQLENEYEVSRKFAHPGLRRSIDMKVQRTFFRRPTEAILVMELFDGRPLDSQSSRNPLTAVDVFIQVAAALDALHAAGFVHCDLKPNNILVDATGHAKVIDFGQACAPGTVKERIQGTPDFISPEQVKCDPVSVRTDVFNFGATLYFSLCGRALPTLFTLKKGQNSFLLDDLIITPASANPLVPESLSNLIMECVKTNPAKRPANLNEVGRRLEIIRHAVERQSNATSTVA